MRERAREIKQENEREIKIEQKERARRSVREIDEIERQRETEKKTE